MMALRKTSLHSDSLLDPQQHSEWENIQVSIERVGALLGRAENLLYGESALPERLSHTTDRQGTQPVASGGGGGGHRTIQTSSGMGKNAPLATLTARGVAIGSRGTARRTLASKLHAEPRRQSRKKTDHRPHGGGGDDDDDDFLDIPIDELRRRIHEELRKFYHNTWMVGSVSSRCHGTAPHWSAKRPTPCKRASEFPCNPGV